MRSRTIHLLLATLVSAPALAEPRILVSPAEPTESDRLRLIVTDDEGCAAYFFAGADPARKTIQLPGYHLSEPCGAPWSWEARLVDHLPPGTYSIQPTLDGEALPTSTVTIAPAPTSVTLGWPGEYYGSSFPVELEWRDPRSGALRQAGTTQLSRLSSGFWFLQPQNLEVTLKILDGRAINGHFWLFLSGMTHLEFTLRVRHCVDGDPPYCSEPVEYHSPAGARAHVVDLSAF